MDTARLPTAVSAPRFYDPGLDIVRFVACTLVFLHHVLSRLLASSPDATPQGVAGALRPLLNLYAQGGGLGVIVFYTLSAYLLGRLFLIENQTTGRVDLRQFWIRRCCRIWPLYFFYLALLAALQVCWAPPLPALPGTGGTFALFSFTYNWVGWQPGLPTSLAVILWSVCVEEQFYLLLMLLLWLGGVKRLPAIGGALVVAGLFARSAITLGRLPYPAVWMMTISHFDAFGLGLLGACWQHSRTHPPCSKGLRTLGVLLALATPAGLAAGFGSSLYSGWSAVVTYLVTALVTLVLIVSLSDRNPASPPGKAAGGMIYLGRRAYGIYVYHWFALNLCPFLLHPKNPGVFDARDAVVVTLSTVLLAAVSYRILEQPFLRLKRRFSAVQSTPGESVAPVT